jgi:uncharacterized protein YqeY
MTTEGRGAATSIAERLRAALVPAMRSRETAAVSAIRSAMAAISNAEAVPTPELDTRAGSGPIAGAVGVGAAETARRELTEDDRVAIVTEEVRERDAAADELTLAGQPEAAERLRAESAALRRLLG